MLGESSGEAGNNWGEEEKVTLEIDGVTARFMNVNNCSKVMCDSPFELLPDDLVLNIMSWLPTSSLCACARVCRRFYFLAWDPRLWCVLRLTDAHVVAGGDTDAALAALLRRVARDSSPQQPPAVTRLELGGCRRLTDNGLMTAAAAGCATGLRAVNLRGCRAVTDRGVSELLARCPQLEQLDVSGKRCVHAEGERERGAPIIIIPLFVFSHI